MLKLFLLGLLVARAAAVCPALGSTVVNSGVTTWPAGAVAGTRVPANCNSPYLGNPPPTWECNGTDWNLLPGKTECWRACTAALPIVPNSFWDPNAVGGTGNTEYAFAFCDKAHGYAGSPMSRCNAFTWEAVIGRCLATPMCLGLPPNTTNNQAQWPLACWDSPAGATCVTTCNGAPSKTLSTTCQVARPGVNSCGGGATWGPIQGVCV